MENKEKPYHLQIMSKAAPKCFEFEKKKRRTLDSIDIDISWYIHRKSNR